jgi:hypothetical protein
VPLFLVALLAVRGVPALLYVRMVARRRAAAGGLPQATTLTFIIVATEIGVETGRLTATTSAALVAAGLLSAALFPTGAARVLASRRRRKRGIPARSGQAVRAPEVKATSPPSAADLD